MTKARIQGVSFHKISGKWQSRVTMNGVRKSLGYFETAEDAAAAYRLAKPPRKQNRKRSNHPSLANKFPPKLARVVPSTLGEALASDHFIGIMGENGAYDPFATEEFALVAAVSKASDLSTWVVSEVFMGIGADYATYANVLSTVNLVRSRGMLERVSEFSDRLAMFEDSPEAALDVMLETEEPPPASRMDQWRFHVAALAQREVWREVWGDEKYRARDQVAGRLGVPLEDVVAEIDAGRMAEPVAGPKRLPYRAGPLETAKRESEALAHSAAPADDLV